MKLSNINTKTGLMYFLASLCVGLLAPYLRGYKINGILEFIEFYFYGILITVFIVAISGFFSEKVLRDEHLIKDKKVGIIIAVTVIVVCFALFVESGLNIWYL